MKRNEARKINHQEVVDEDKRAKEPKNMEARKRRAEYILKEEEMKAECIAAGRDWAIEKKRLSKLNPDEGFSSFENATFRKYGKLTAQIKPDMQTYAENKEKAGEAFYATVGTVVHGVHKDTQEAIDKMAADVEAQKAKRDKFSRRRRHNPDNDIDYINERNMKFNQKCERFYGEYTKDIKDNLERGTAV